NRLGHRQGRVALPGGMALVGGVGFWSWLLRQGGIMQRDWYGMRFVHHMMKQSTFALIAIFTLTLCDGFSQVRTTTIQVDDLKQMQPRNVKVEQVTYKGRKALRVTDAAPPNAADGIQLVILNKTDFQDGVIEIELTGEPGANAGAEARGFVGVAFRVNLDAAKDTAKYECFYLRPTNGRADDQARRNHSSQYISYPDFPWYRLR